MSNRYPFAADKSSEYIHAIYDTPDRPILGNEKTLDYCLRMAAIYMDGARYRVGNSNLSNEDLALMLEINKIREPLNFLIEKRYKENGK